MGEYYNPDSLDPRENGRLREIIERLRDEDSRQNHRLQELEDAIAVMRADIQGLWNGHNRIEVALIGHDGRNGIRGTMMDHYKQQSQRLGDVEQAVKGLTKNVDSMTTTLKTISKAFGAISAVIGTVGIIVGIVVAF